MLKIISSKRDYFIIYWNFLIASKSFLDIPEELLKEKGAVSKEVAIRMAESIKNRFNVNIGISTTGISGPGGGTVAKPVGIIYIALASKNKKIVKKFNLIQNRKEHRKIAVHTAFNMLRLFIKEK